MRKNPFGDDTGPTRPVNPFGEEPEETVTPAEAAGRIEQSARKIRALRSQLGAEGMSPQAMRELIGEIATGFEAAARALRSIQR